VSNQIDLSQRVEIRYATGDTVGIVLAPNAVQELTAERDQLREESNRLRAEVAELRRALEEAKREVRDKADIVAERDQYLRSLHALLAKDVQITAEDIAELDKNGVDVADVIAEIETDFRSRGLLDDD
jgi:predicted RNase H-like nuclease (RuvC/YqgF family)